MKLFVLVLVIRLPYSANQIGPSNQYQTDVDKYYPSFNFSTALDWKILKEFSVRYTNFIVSPVSIRFILALLYEGGKEVQNILEFEDEEANIFKNRSFNLLGSLKSTTETLIDIQTSLFLDYPIEVDEYFRDEAKSHFKTDINPTNFSNPKKSSNDINTWAWRATHGRIKKIINPKELEKTVMLITNSVYFKGTWLHKFPRDKSDYDTFHRLCEGLVTDDVFLSVTVPFMTVTDSFYYGESSELDCKMIRLPYVGNSYAMFIVLPNSLAGLTSLIEKLRRSHIIKLMNNLRRRVVEVHIPKFNFNFQVKFADFLLRNDVQQLFRNPGSFTGKLRDNRTQERHIVLSDIVQISGIAIDEEGTLADTYTEINAGNNVSEPEAYFNATHSFIFFIEGPNAALLYLGVVEVPLGGVLDNNQGPESIQQGGPRCLPTSSKVSNKLEVCGKTVIFEDNFDQNSFDTSKWWWEQYIPEEPDYEFVVYKKDPEITFVSGNQLTIKPKVIEDEAELTRKTLDISEGCTREGTACKKERHLIHNPVISGRIVTHVLFRYGVFETRVKLPGGDWIFPEIYLEDSNNQKLFIAYARGNEHLVGKDGIDIGAKLLFGGPVLHSHEPKRSEKLSSYRGNASFTSDFHTYKLIWSPNQIELFVDGIIYGLIDRHSIEPSSFAGNDGTLVKLVIGVGVGGINDFPDGYKSGSYDKPWKNGARNMTKTFYNKKEEWYKETWNSNSQLQIDYVKITSL